MNFPLQMFFNDNNHGCRVAILKKNCLWLLPFYMLWLLIFIIKRCAERCTLQFYQTFLKQKLYICIYTHFDVSKIYKSLKSWSAIILNLNKIN